MALSTPPVKLGTITNASFSCIPIRVHTIHTPNEIEARGNEMCPVVDLDWITFDRESKGDPNMIIENNAVKNPSCVSVFGPKNILTYMNIT